jgi:predicted nucleic acid-binding protein
MTSAIWIDAHVPIYSFGRDHEMKAPSTYIISLIELFPSRFATDSEVLQELLHRYVSLRLWDHYRGVFTDFVNLMADATEAVFGVDIEVAAGLHDRYPGPSSRDLVHAAVMHRVGSTHIVSADRGFDDIDGITRLDPLRVKEWEPMVAGGR